MGTRSINVACAEGIRRTVGRGYRSFDRRCAFYDRRPIRPCLCGERHRPWPPDPVARRPGCPTACDQRPARRQFDPLAWPSGAFPVRWRAGSKLSRHQAGRNVHLRLSDPTERHLLVAFALRPSGAGRTLRPDRRRKRRTGYALRSGLRGPAFGIHADPPARGDAIAQGGRTLLPASDANRQRRRHVGRDAPHVGPDADEPARYLRCDRNDVYLPDQRARSCRQVAASVPPRRTRAPAHHQRLRHDVLQRPHSRSSDDRHPGRRAGCGRGRSRRITDRRCRNLRRDRRADRWQPRGRCGSDGSQRHGRGQPHQPQRPYCRATAASRDTDADDDRYGHDGPFRSWRPKRARIWAR